LQPRLGGKPGSVLHLLPAWEGFVSAGRQAFDAAAQFPSLGLGEAPVKDFGLLCLGCGDRTGKSWVDLGVRLPQREWCSVDLISVEAGGSYFSDVLWVKSVPLAQTC